jgi:hypothetical protein
MEAVEAYPDEGWARMRRRAGPNDDVSPEGGSVYLYASLVRMPNDPVEAFEGRSWLAQLRLEAPKHGAEAVVHRGHLYLVWGAPLPFPGP